MDFVKLMQDPEAMSKLTELPTLILEKLENIEKQNAEILQICNSVNTYLRTNIPDTERRVYDPE